MLIRNSREKDNSVVDAAGDFSQHPLPREMPQSIDAEQALLGAILVNNYAYDRVSEFLTAEHFFDPLHAQIFGAIAQLIQEGKQAVPVTLAPFFEAAGPIDDDLTVPQYLVRLAVNATTIINAKDYGRTIHDLYVRRQIILLAEDMANSAFDAPIDFPPDNQIQEAEGRLYQLAEKGTGGTGEISFSVAASQAVERANAAYRNKGKLVGLPTGLADLDKKLGGLQPSDLVVLAGRPSMGKTALATNIGWHIAKNGRELEDGEIAPTPVHFFSLEMSAEQLAARILAAEASVSSDRVRRGAVDDREISDFIRAGHRRSGVPLIIDATGGISIAQLAQRARRTKRKHGTSLIVVDYIQLMSGAKKRDGNRVAEITEITTGLKALAKELNVPILALSQLSRKVEERADKRPQLADLKESGSIEQDADVVMFVFREEYYVEREKPGQTDLAKMAEWSASMAAVKGKAEVIIGKQRHGPLGVIPLAFNAELTTFSDLARERHSFGMEAYHGP